MMLTSLMRVVLACSRVPGRVGVLVRGAVNGLLLGLLPEARLRALDELYYARADLYRSATWNEAGLLPWEQQAVTDAFTPGSRVVVVACGGGREVLALLRAGFDATGYESHPLLRGYAEAFLRERGFSGRVLEVGRDEFPDSGPCDGVLVGWGAYSLITPAARRASFLRSLAAELPGEGPVVLSGFAQEGLGGELRLTARLARAVARCRGARQPIELGDTLAPNRVHVFTPASLAAEIEHSGLSVRGVRLVAARGGSDDYAGASVDYAYAMARKG